MNIDRFNPYKILKYSNRLQLLANDNICLPLIWHVYPTNSCTNNCNFCIMKDDRNNYKNASMSKTLLEYIVSEALTNFSKTIHFSGGGEPLLNPHTLGAIKLAKEKGLKVALSTNLNINFSNYHDIAHIIANNVDYLRVSLNAGTKETYNQIMRPKGKDTFKRVIDNLWSIIKKGHQGDLGLAMVITDENAFEITKFCELANNLGFIDFVHIRPAYWPERDKKIYETVQNNLQVYSENDIKNAYPDLNINIRLDKFAGYWTPDRGYSKCRATPLLACVKATGDMILCQDTLDSTFGNLNEKSFHGIWDSKEHVEAIKDINLNSCPRCVEGPKNQIIESCFVRDDWRGDLF